MNGAPNTQILDCLTRIMKVVSGTFVSEEIADIFCNYNVD